MKAATAIEASAVRILDEIGEPPDLTLVTGRGNWGDRLILEGTRALLSSKIYSEVAPEAVCGARGHTALIVGSGAFCRPFNELMPRVLSIAAMRFERVIVLPSSFDPSDDVVREVLSSTRATVFARETESYRRIVSICDARLAHDCAFFFDYGPYRSKGHGVLTAFRTDPERLSERQPEGNNDISETAASFEDWLAAIAAHELIRTDRAHVVIAAAMLGKRVEFASSSYHKLPALAGYALADYPVSEIQPSAAGPVHLLAPRTAAGRDQAERPERRTAARVTAIVPVREASEGLPAIEALASGESLAEVLVIDVNAPPSTTALLVAACERKPGLRLHRSDRELGPAAARALGAQITYSEYLLFLDERTVPEPGAVELLVAELDRHPGAAAVCATVLAPDGSVEHSGGWFAIGKEIADFRLIAAGDSPEAVPPSGAADWVPGTAVLIRRSLLDRVPLDTGHRGPGWDLREWCLRVQRACPGSLRRCREALAVHRGRRHPGPGVDFGSRALAVQSLESHAHFWLRQGLLLVNGLGELMPELLDAGGALDEQAGRLLMELMVARGSDWALMEWMNGGLEPLFSRSALSRFRAAYSEQAERVVWLTLRNQTLERIEQGGWWRLRAKLMPALRLFWRVRRRPDGF